MSGGSDFEMKKTSLFYSLEDDKIALDELALLSKNQGQVRDQVQIIKDELHKIQRQIAALEEF